VAVSGLDTEQPRYYLQHALRFQVHDIRHPHRQRRHGRADIGWKDGLGQPMADWTDLTYAVVDVEGNGQQPPDLVELAVVPVTGDVIGELTSWLVRPGWPIRYFAARIHGVTNKDVADAPPFATVRDDVLSVLRASAIVAHNAGYASTLGVRRR